MSRRIDWAAEGEDEDSDDNEGEQQQEEGEQKPRKKVGPNWCKLVWEGVAWKHVQALQRGEGDGAEVRDFSGFGRPLLRPRSRDHRRHRGLTMQTRPRGAVGT